jgi:hypothetical protein
MLMSKNVQRPNSAPSEDSLADSTRRGMLRATASLAGIAALFNFTGLRSAAAAKKLKTQAEVEYQPTPKGKQNCENCDLFIAPDKCKSVEGTVVAQGWCKIWVAY